MLKTVKVKQKKNAWFEPITMYWPKMLQVRSFSLVSLQNWNKETKHAHFDSCSAKCVCRLLDGGNWCTHQSNFSRSNRHSKLHETFFFHFCDNLKRVQSPWKNSRDIKLIQAEHSAGHHWFDSTLFGKADFFSIWQ